MWGLKLAKVGSIVGVHPLRKTLRRVAASFTTVVAIAFPRPVLAGELGITHIFLLIGQSNMAGRGIVEASDCKSYPSDYWGHSYETVVVPDLEYYNIPIPDRVSSLVVNSASVEGCTNP